MGRGNPDPNKATRFRPGVSGNPAGSHKGKFRSIVEAIRKQLDARTLEGKKLPRNMTVLDALVEAILKYALKGNAVLLKEIIDRVDGRLPQPPPAPAGDAGGPRDDCVIVVPSFVPADGTDDPPPEGQDAGT
jgi:hypothetical protein